MATDPTGTGAAPSGQTGDPAPGSARDVARRTHRGEMSSTQVVDTYLAHIDAEEPRVQAWAHLARDHARTQAEVADRARQQGNPLGPLHGVPVGIKDIFDTFDMPTQYGTPLYTDRQPQSDAAAVERLRSAGAIVMGKTVTTEMAVYSPGKTRNPHNPEHTPGGSSSGSAAAVADGMVPLALGTQTNGSVIRPASFCGVYGYKPSYGRISRHGCLTQSPALDQVGVFAATLEDAALMAQTVMGYDSRDRSTAMVAAPDLETAALAEPALEPRLAFCKTPAWERIEDETATALAELCSVLGEAVGEVPLPESFTRAHERHRTVMESDIARHFAADQARGRHLISAELNAIMDRGWANNAPVYADAVDAIETLNDNIQILLDDADAILTPATPGPAPKGLESTGDPAFCSIWTYCGMPALSLPLLTASNGLPVGVQLVAARGDDARLMRVARWLIRKVREAA